MSRSTVVIIGAGHAGLAMSRCLTERSIDHVLIERGEVANSWKTQRWDSLHLLTPNWMSRLPGYRYQGEDPDGFRTLAETIAFIQGYADDISAPVKTHTTVTRVTPRDGGYQVATDQGDWQCRAVVLASGACKIPSIPAFARAIPPGVATLDALAYRSPGQIADGGVMVVGAASSGTQIADELARAGRRVTLCVGEHIRAPRSYRGRDIQWWMDAAGILDERYDELENLPRARRLSSIQLVGSNTRRTLDLNALTDQGVELIGRLATIRDGKALFSGSLRNMCTLSDLKMNRLLDRIDEWITEAGLDGEVAPPHRFEPTRVPDKPRLSMDLSSGEIETIIWATGFRPDHSFFELPVFDHHRGLIRHDGGVIENAPGAYLIGMPVLRTRRSTFIDGSDADARFLSAHLADHLAG